MRDQITGEQSRSQKVDRLASRGIFRWMNLTLLSWWEATTIAAIPHTMDGPMKTNRGALPTTQGKNPEFFNSA